MAETDTKVCPYCAETIKADAIVCRYCGRELDTKPIKKNPKSNALFFVVVGVLLLVMCVFIYFSLGLGSGGSGGTGSGSTGSSNSSKSVVYEITGNGVTRVSLTWQNNTGGTEQGDSSIPWRRSYSMESGDFTYVSAQITEPTQYAGSIECKITINGEVVYQASANGFASIATCSGPAR